MPVLEPWQWALAAFCAFLTGVAKTGVPGLGILVVPLMVLVVGNARESAGWLLPLLCAADCFAVFYYRRHAQARRLWELLPWVVGGMAVGAAALALDERWLKALVGVIVLAMIVAHVLRKRHADRPVPDDWQHAARYGTVAGFATTVANAAGPVMNLFLLSKRLPKEEFIATGAWFFLVINLAKVPIYAGLYDDMITARSLAFDAALLPAILIGALSGRMLFTRIPQKGFEVTVLSLATLATLLMFKGLFWG